MSGRQLLIPGVIAMLGLVSVRDSQRQVELSYKLAALEKQSKNARQESELMRTQYRALQAPGTIENKVKEILKRRV